MSILRIAFTSGLLLALALTVRVGAGLVVEVVRDGRRPVPQVAQIAPPCPCQYCAHATTRGAA